MKSEVRFPAAFLDRAARMADILNATRSPSEQLDPHAVIRALAARGLGEPLPYGIAPSDLDSAVNATRSA
jgi:hypothetical protein